MNILLDNEMKWLAGAVIVFLALSSITAFILKKTLKSDEGLALTANLTSRIRAWWLMVAIFFAALLTRGVGTIILFAVTSFLAFREYVTITPTHRRDHRALFWAFFVILPVQYYFLYIHWYGMFSIFIPVYAFIFIPIRLVLSGSYERFLERTAAIQWGLMVCVYFVSHVPALLMLDIKGYENRNASLLFFLVLVVEIGDVFQYVWGKLCGKRPIAPSISPNKTVAGFVGGVLTASLVGAALWKVTPFTPLQALAVSLLITVLGFFGGLTMSAIKRDRGVKDYGTALGGHGGVMDRIDSLCFAAPVFFHVVRYFFT